MNFSLLGATEYFQRVLKSTYITTILANNDLIFTYRYWNLRLKCREKHRFTTVGQ